MLFSSQRINIYHLQRIRVSSWPMLKSSTIQLCVYILISVSNIKVVEQERMFPSWCIALATSGISPRVCPPSISVWCVRLSEMERNRTKCTEQKMYLTSFSLTLSYAFFSCFFSLRFLFSLPISLFYLTFHPLLDLDSRKASCSLLSPLNFCHASLTQQMMLFVGFFFLNGQEYSLVIFFTLFFPFVSFCVIDSRLSPTCIQYLPMWSVRVTPAFFPSTTVVCVTITLCVNLPISTLSTCDYDNKNRRYQFVFVTLLHLSISTPFFVTPLFVTTTL